MERKQIRILVKAYPERSKTHGSSICTAGLVNDKEWIRIYPVDLNYYLEHKDVFKKWNVIEADVEPKKEKIERKESHKVSEKSIGLVDKSLSKANLTDRDWDARNRIVLSKLRRSVRELDEEKDLIHTSIGLIKPAKYKFHLKDEIENIKIEKEDTVQTRLFGPPIMAPDKIEKKFAYKFYCEDLECSCNVKGNGHDMICEDYELLESFRIWQKKYNDLKVLEAKLIDRYDTYMKQQRELYFILGTTHLYGTWVIIGLYYPPKKKTASLDSFMK